MHPRGLRKGYVPFREKAHLPPHCLPEQSEGPKCIRRRGLAASNLHRSFVSLKMTVFHSPPPYTGMAAPVMSLPASPASHAIRLATEAGCTHCETSAPGIACRLVGVCIVPGRIAFAVTPASLVLDSEAAVGSGNQGNSSCHRCPHPTGTHRKCSLAGCR